MIKFEKTKTAKWNRMNQNFSATIQVYSKVDIKQGA